MVGPSAELGRGGIGPHELAFPHFVEQTEPFVGGRTSGFLVGPVLGALQLWIYDFLFLGVRVSVLAHHYFFGVDAIEK